MTTTSWLNITSTTTIKKSKKADKKVRKVSAAALNPVLIVIRQGSSLFMNRKDLAYYQNEDEDPYIVAKEEDEAEEREELEILPTDNLLLAAKTEEDVSQLEVYVYEKEADNLYVHHDIILPSFPLCLEWLDYHTGEKSGAEGSGNYVAIGTFEPDIEIWNLDIVDAMLPQTILGYSDKDKKRSKKVNDKYHVDAIMDLSWNKQHRYCPLTIVG